MRTCYAMRYASAAVLWVSAVTTAPAGAQIMASERAMVAQTVDGTRLTVDYSRPRARGRTNIYGGMEKWGITWTPGADDATTLELSKPVQLLGMTVPRGKYSVWLVLREQGPWTFVLDPRDSLFHTDHPDSTAQQWRAPVMPMRVPHPCAYGSAAKSFCVIGVVRPAVAIRIFATSAAVTADARLPKLLRT